MTGGGPVTSTDLRSWSYTCAGDRVVPVRPRLLLALLLSACASTGRYTCPAPIGEIVRDDCEQYRVRYEKMAVDVGASLAGVVGGNVKVGSEQTHAPSELVQLLATRAHALCQDWNACRLAPEEYRRRRDELDRTFVVVAALSAELRAPSLSEPERQRILERLLAALGGPPTDRAPAEPVAATRREPFFGRYWLGARTLPPSPGPVADGVPRLLGEPQLALRLQFIRDGKDSRDSFLPTVRVDLYGRLEPDDVLEADFGSGTVSCLVRKDAKGKDVLHTVACAERDGTRRTDRAVTVALAYRRAATGQRSVLGTWRYTILEHPNREAGIRAGVHHYGVDVDAERERAYLAFDPEPRFLPAAFERPSVMVTLRLRGKYPPPTLRCQVGGALVTDDAIRPGRGGAQLETYQDRPRYHEKGNSSIAEPAPEIEWRRFAFPLPFVLPHDQATPPPGLGLLSGRPGAWLCTVTAGGEKLREVTFRIGADGRPEPHATQRGTRGGIDSPWWRVEARPLPNAIEANLEAGR